ncbi:YciI family protein [Neopusillimonas maritima]|uniref:YCII-related domain-containing protein n=1 Tax=Neopusillimonas maritima TaxID=2026239 RepID=A0A3A1YXP0_9BURK|nr:YciI family protein [Neopusillimonas maritima]RIY42281.1 hypothetical protein CJP73_02290 [Neopusillimonas maritima]
MFTPETQRLIEGMLNKPLFVVFRKPADLSKFASVLEAHLKWAVQSEKRGEIFASGPFVQEGGVPGAAGGMSILRAASEEEANAILSGDPFIKEGVYTVEVKKWMLMEGGLSVTLHFSDQKHLLR